MIIPLTKIEGTLVAECSGQSIQPLAPTRENLLKSLNPPDGEVFQNKGWQLNANTLESENMIINVSTEECWAAMYRKN